MPRHNAGNYNKRTLFGIILILSLLALPAIVQAQAIRFVWTRWDAILDVQPEGDTLAISETQEFAIREGTARFGSRTWTQPVDVRDVFVVMGGSSTPVQLARSGGGEPGTYTVAQSGDDTELTYYLPRAASSGDTFVAQINYAAPIPVEGLVDWIVIPSEHGAPVESSTVTINFPPGEAPDRSLVRVAAGAGAVEQNGNSFTVRSQGPLAANEMLVIQIPFGADVGAAGEPVGNAEPAAPVAPAAPAGDGIGIGSTTVLALLCGVGLLVLLGGGGLLRNLLPALLGSGLGTTRRYNPLGRSVPRSSGLPSFGRGFRRSSNQSRNLPQVGRRKDGGGSAGLG